MQGQGATLQHWWPVTCDFGLIRADIDIVADAWSKMFEESGTTVRTAWLEGSLEECFLTLEPLSPAPTRELFLATTFGWTAYYSSGFRGSDPFLPMSKLSRALGVTALRACVTPKTARYQGVILEVYDTADAGGDAYGYRRSIAAVNDGGRWVFHQSGTPYAFEDISRYAERRKRDRFTSDMLAAYLRNLGIPELRDETLQPDGRCRGFLLARPTHAHLRSYSLAEAKALEA
jgi:hypothetical protein